MKEITIRALSGILYVALIISSALLSDVAFLLVISVFSSLALFEFQRLLNYRSPVPFLLFGLLIYQYHTNQINTTTLYGILGFALITNLILSYLLFSNKTIPIVHFQKTSWTLFYVVCSAYLIIATSTFESSLNNGNTLIMYFMIWINNSFAYLSGKTWGKKPLFSSISPKKTWEGFWGGAFVTILTALTLSFFFKSLNLWEFLLLAVLIITTATVGDLIQSKFKRQAQIKDSGSLIPGHGGFYDRMDSVLFTAPFVYLYLIIIENVS
jgi:phosphatidate cytidylyltransferase